MEGIVDKVESSKVFIRDFDASGIAMAIFDGRNS